MVRAEHPLSAAEAAAPAGGVPQRAAIDAEAAALRIIAEGTASTTGEVFFRRLVEHLARALGTRHAFVARFIPPQHIRTLASRFNLMTIRHSVRP